MKLSLYKISEGLIEATEKYGEKYPKLKTLELQYTKEFDRLLMEAQSIFGNQPSREAYARQELAKLPFFEEFMALQVEVHLIQTKMRNFQQISRNLINASYGGGETTHE